VDLAEEDKRRINTEIDEYIAQYPTVMKNHDDFRAFITALREKEKYERSLGRAGHTNVSVSPGGGGNGSSGAGSSGGVYAHGGVANGAASSGADTGVFAAQSSSPMALSSPSGMMENGMDAYDDDGGFE